MSILRARGFIAAAVSIPLVLVLTAGTPTSLASFDGVVDQYHSAMSNARGEVSANEKLATQLSKSIQLAGTAVKLSNGQVLQQTEREKASQDLSAASAVLSALRTNDTAATKTIRDNSVDGSAWLWDYSIALSAMKKLDSARQVDKANQFVVTLGVDRTAISTAVTAWTTEQARIAAAKLAADQAAAAAALAQQATVHHSSGAAHPAIAPGPRSYTVNVRTTVTVNVQSDVATAQAAINAGGDVGVYYSYVHVMDVSAHTENDSLALRLNVGDTVTLVGALSGSYRVTGAVWVGHVTSSAALSSLGTPYSMQTCSGSNMRLVGLQPIG